jgi:hypothetical protein
MISAVGFEKGREFFGEKLTAWYAHVSTDLFGVSTKVCHKAPIDKMKWDFEARKSTC